MQELNSIQFQRIGEAYQELKDKERRLSVDSWMSKNLAGQSSVEGVDIEINLIGRCCRGPLLGMAITSFGALLEPSP
eukprot:g24187.t1